MAHQSLEIDNRGSLRIGPEVGQTATCARHFPCVSLQSAASSRRKSLRFRASMTKSLPLGKTRLTRSTQLLVGTVTISGGERNTCSSCQLAKRRS